MLYDKTLVYVGLESTFGTDVVPTSVDALEVIEPQFGPDFTKLERKIVNGSLSPNRIGLGMRKATLDFQLEVKGSGSTSAEGKLARLLKACSMTAVQKTGLSGANGGLLFGYPVPFGIPSNTFTLAQTDAFTGVSVRRILLTCTTPGVSGTCKFTAQSPAVGTELDIDQAEATFTSGAEFVINDTDPTEVVSFTPTFTGAFAEGDQFVIYTAPAGWAYYPRTGDDTEALHSVSLYCFYDGLLHKLSGCRGTWSMTAGAGEFAMFSFKFTGNYIDAVDVAFPTNPTFETTEPAQTELARMWLPKYDGTVDQAICAAQFGFDIGNSVTGRRCVNDRNGYAGAKVSSRKPQFTADPEMVIEANHGFWHLFETAKTYDVMGMISDYDDNDDPAPGNTVAFVGPQAQTDAQPYANRDNTRVANLTANLARIKSNDELVVFLG